MPLWNWRGWVLAAIFLLTRGASAADGLSGTFTVPGNQGNIVLTLRDAGEGKVTGSLKGGALSLQLEGFPNEGGGVLGTAKTDDGTFASYFQAARQGNQLLFDLIQANQDGDPDMANARRITFPVNGVSSSASPEPAKTQTATASTGAFSGTWKGDGLTFESRAQGNDCLGTLTLNNQKMPFTATAVNQTLHGTFEAGGERFDFQGSVQNGVLVINSAGTEYRLQKQGAPAKPASNPLAKPATNQAKASVKNQTANKSTSKSTKSQKAAPIVAKTAKASKVQPVKMTRPGGAATGGAAWKSFKHAVGLGFRYPANWTLKEAGPILMLIPPDVKQIDGGPSELFLMKAEAAGQIQSASDPRLEEALSKYVTQTFPAFQPLGNTQTIQVGNQPGILMQWEGESKGYAMRLQSMTVILKSFMVSMVTISTKDQIKASRDQTVKQIFESLVAGAGKKDPKVAGKWFLYSYKGSGSYGRETKSYMTLLPDGTALWGQKSESSWSGTGKNMQGETTWTAGVASQGNDADRGSWSADKGVLIIAWGDGKTAVWSYRVGGSPGGNRRLFLKGTGKEDEWMETN